MSIAILPYDAAIGAEIDDTFDTSVSESSGGISGRSSVRRARIRQFHLTIGPDDVEDVRALFDTHRKRWPIGVRDWGSYIFTDEVLTYTTSGSNVLAPLQRTITPSTGSRFTTARILYPDETEEDIVIKVNGTPISRGSWTLTDSGIAQIPSGTVGSGTVTVSGRDVVPCCFMDDSLTVKVLLGANPDIDQDAILSIPDVRLREILEDELTTLLAQTDDSA